MAFFCIKSGARIVAPGIAVSAGGAIPDFDGAKPEHAVAEHSAAVVLASVPGKDDGEPTPAAKEAAVRAAESVLTDPKNKVAGKGGR
jgi:hypothetical protein